MSSSVRCVACTALVSGPRTPWSASSWVGVAPYAATQASFSCGLLGEMDVEGLALAGVDDGAELVVGDGADGVDRGAGVVRSLARSAQASAVPSLNRPLDALGWLAEAAAEVRRVEQPDPEAGLLGRLDQRVAHGVRVVVRRPVRLVVQVVELPHARDPARHHLLVRRRRERQVGVRVEPLRHGVHPLPPRPERPPLLLRPPPQRPVERVAVAVRQARDGEAGDPVGDTRSTGYP